MLVLTDECRNQNLYSIIQDEMLKQGYTISSLSKEISANSGVLSGSLNALSKPIPIPILDAITRVFGYPDGWLYAEYMADCFREGKAHWRRVKALLLRCLDLKRSDLITQTLDNLMEDPHHLQAVFKLAEELYEAGQQWEAIPFYQCVVENEIKQHSERFAVSHYKWFRAEIDRGLDMERYKEAVIRFRPYTKRLPEYLQLDALLQLTNTYFILQEWRQVEAAAEEMLALTLICLQQQKERKKRPRRPTKDNSTNRHLVVYYGQSYLLRGNALEKQGRYEEAFAYIKQYEDLSGFDDLDGQGRKEAERFMIFAAANRLNLYTLMGRFEHLMAYIAFLDKHPEERIPGILTVLEAALRYHRNIDDVLLHFEDDVQVVLNDSFEQRSRGYYHSSFSIHRRNQLAYALAVYQFNQNRVGVGLDYLLIALELAMAASNEHLSLACAAWFVKHQNQANEVQKRRFEITMKGMVQNAEVDFGIIGDDHRHPGERSGASQSQCTLAPR